MFKNLNNLWLALCLCLGIIGAVDATQDVRVIGTVRVRAPGEAPVHTAFSNTEQLDSFGRLRVSEPVSVFEAQFLFNAQPLIFTSSATGGGSVTHSTGIASVLLNVGTSSGDSAIFQSKQYFRYHAGKSQSVVFTGNMAGEVVNCRRRFGQFDASNGYFFELDGTTLTVVVRSSTSGVVVDRKISQSNWNLDKLDGTGSSTVTMDMTLQQVWYIDYQWLGSGRIRYGVYSEGEIIYCHQILNANRFLTPYSQTATLPVRFENVNTGVAASSTTAHVTCVTVFSEGGFSPEGLAFTVNTSTTLKSVAATGKIPLLTIRKSTGGLNIPVRLTGMNAFCATADDLLITLTANATLTGATFAQTIDLVQADTAAVAMSGGTEVFSFYLRGAAGATSIYTEADFFTVQNVVLGSTLQGTSDQLTLSATSLSGLATAGGIFNLREIY